MAENLSNEAVPKNQHLVLANFIWHLNKQVPYYLDILESKFGPRNPKFKFVTVQKSQNDIPHISFPGGYNEDGCVVDIRIGAEPWESCKYGHGTWQVAHECVHLLDPVVGGTTNLEEGLASWFQNDPRFHSDSVKQYIVQNKKKDARYEVARNLVLCCMPQLIPAVKEIRSSGTRIRDITTDALAEKLHDVDSNIIEKLCSSFPYTLE